MGKYVLEKGPISSNINQLSRKMNGSQKEIPAGRMSSLSEQGDIFTCEICSKQNHVVGNTDGRIVGRQSLLDVCCYDLVYFCIS